MRCANATLKPQPQRWLGTLSKRNVGSCGGLRPARTIHRTRRCSSDQNCGRLTEVCRSSSGSVARTMLEFLCSQACSLSMRKRKDASSVQEHLRGYDKRMDKQNIVVTYNASPEQK